MSCVRQLGVIALLMSLGSVHQPQGAKKLRISEIRLLGNDRVAEQTFWNVILSRPGDIYHEDRIRTDFRKLNSTGLFSDVRVVRSPEPNGVRITFEVTERPLIERLEFSGLHSLSPEEAEAAFIQQAVRLLPGELFDPLEAHRGVQLLGRMLSEKGRPLASVRFRKKKAGPGSVSLLLDVREGPQVLLTAIHFEGNSVFSDQQLREMLRLHALPAVYLADRLEYDITNNLLSRYWSRGYILAQTGAAQIELQKEQGNASQIVTIPIEEGPQFRNGRFHIEGFRAVSPQRLRDLFRFEEGQPVNLARLRQATDELMQIYRNLGYLDFETDPSVEPELKNRTVDLTIRALEGPQYRVGRIEVKGTRPEHEALVQQALEIEAEEVFNPHLLQDSIARLNRLGLFQEITADDYDLEKDSQQGRVHLSIRLQPSRQY